MLMEFTVLGSFVIELLYRMKGCDGFCVSFTNNLHYALHFFFFCYLH